MILQITKHKQKKKEREEEKLIPIILKLNYFRKFKRREDS